MNKRDDKVSLVDMLIAAKAPSEKPTANVRLSLTKGNSRAARTAAAMAAVQRSSVCS